jgi:hypothetical protein
MEMKAGPEGREDFPRAHTGRTEGGANGSLCCRHVGEVSEKAVTR